jgi:hypothetical protein
VRRFFISTPVISQSSIQLKEVETAMASKHGQVQIDMATLQQLSAARAAATTYYGSGGKPRDDDGPDFDGSERQSKSAAAAAFLARMRDSDIN